MHKYTSMYVYTINLLTTICNDALPGGLPGTVLRTFPMPHQRWPCCRVWNICCSLQCVLWHTVCSLTTTCLNWWWTSSYLCKYKSRHTHLSKWLKAKHFLENGQCHKYATVESQGRGNTLLRKLWQRLQRSYEETAVPHVWQWRAGELQAMLQRLNCSLTGKKKK